MSIVFRLRWLRVSSFLSLLFQLCLKLCGLLFNLHCLFHCLFFHGSRFFLDLLSFFFDLLVGLNNLFKCLNSPVVGLLPNPLFIAWRLVKVGIINGLTCILWVKLVCINFLILVVVDVLERKSHQFLLISIDDNPLIEWCRCKAVFHSSNYLTSMIVYHADVGNCSCCKHLILILVLLNKCWGYVLELMFIIIGQVHLIVFLDCHNVRTHHTRKQPAPLDGCKVKLTQVLKTGVYKVLIGCFTLKSVLLQIVLLLLHIGLYT